MIISRTPFRISFFGGGTDYPEWCRKNGGAVLSTTINKYCYITCRYLPPFFSHRFRIVYSKIENSQNIDEVKHPAVREILRFLKFERGLEIHHDGDLPARSGLGSSSAFTVGLLHALYALKGIMPSKNQLAKESIYIEQEMIKETVGIQDQVATAYGGFNHIQFFPSGEISTKPITLTHERMTELNGSLMLFFSGIKRTASDIAQSYVQNMENKRKKMNLLMDMVNEAISILNSGENLVKFGQLMHEGWQIKKALSSRISNTYIEDIYKKAIESGAIGGKLIGAGGGGFMLFFVQPKDQEKVKERLRNLVHVPFKFEFNGSQIIFFEPEEDFSSIEKEISIRKIKAFREYSKFQLLNNKKK